MFSNSPLKVLFRRSKLIFLVGILVAMVASALTFLFPLQYRADAQVLIISKTRTGVDPYTVVRSAERVGENVAQVMKTDDFYQKVKSQADNGVDWNYFESDGERSKRKIWQSTLVPSVVYGTGVLNISTFHSDAQEATKIASAAANALVTQGWEYVGGDVTMKVVNEPVATKWPVKPNIFLNALLGFIVGVLLMSVLVLRK